MQQQKQCIDIWSRARKARKAVVDAFFGICWHIFCMKTFLPSGIYCNWQQIQEAFSFVKNFLQPASEPAGMSVSYLRNDPDGSDLHRWGPECVCVSFQGQWSRWRTRLDPSPLAQSPENQSIVYSHFNSVDLKWVIRIARFSATNHRWACMTQWSGGNDNTSIVAIDGLPPILNFSLWESLVPLPRKEEKKRRGWKWSLL